ncbi:MULTISPECIES: hypothetical protein [Nostocales]|uniref:Uncharacterized protein n=2 Tax=Nostocales TaxID=1161 RepID=A0A8S9T2F6_9CYAN|nr:hypothetical protein [Tolypothrix bouteillei]KAF3886525.1 hypothetical protein DA73_0400014325 [Tolypothrix bouteillei VB521301]
MKFQIECSSLIKHEFCLICDRPIQRTEARLIVCSDQGDGFGDICPKCIGMGAYWIKNQLQHLSSYLSSKA